MNARHRKNRRNKSFYIRAIILLTCLSLSAFAYKLLARPAGILSKYDVSYAIIDIASGNYIAVPETASGNSHAEQFPDIIQRLKPYAAITGTYYDENYKPLGDIVREGKVIYRGHQRQGIGFTSSGEIKFLERKPNSRINWSGCISGIACGPRLLRNGKKDINAKRDGFSKKAEYNEAWRCAVGATKNGKLILCAVKNSVTLSTLSDIMLELGAQDAINMDGGSMCALYVDGKYLVEPVRPMSNILAVYKKCNAKKRG